MNPIQSKIEQTAKEYLNYKVLVDKSAEKAKKEKENIAEKVIGMDKEEIYNIYFDTFVSLEFLVKDMLQLKTKLYNQIELVKDTVDIPEEISDLVLDYNQPLMFAIINDERIIVEQKLYDDYKKQYILRSKEMSELKHK